MLADSGAAWTDIIAQHNSGTYNNQYVVVDLKRFKPGQVITDDVDTYASFASHTPYNQICLQINAGCSVLLTELTHVGRITTVKTRILLLWP